jgi:hypothetical protein
MTLQSSGPISLLDIQNEFGGSNPIGIDEYYGITTGIPISGTISIADFYGKSTPPTTNGLIANWKPSSYSGTGNWNDSYTADATGNNYMIKVGSPTYTSGTPSYFTTSNNNHWEVADAAKPTGSYAAASIFFWLYQTSGTSVQGGLENRYGSGTQFGLEIQSTGSIGRIGYFWNDNASNTWGYNTTLTLDANTWYLVGLTLDSTEVIFYRGTSSTLSTNTRTFTHTAQTIASNNKFYYGSDPENTGRGFQGRLGECWFYNRKLSNSEVTTLYNSTKATYGF